MNSRKAPRLVAGITVLGGLIAGFGLSARQAPAQSLSGFDVYRSNCGGCHELYDPEAPKRPRAEWDKILTRMVKVRGATLNKQEYAAVLAYLDSFNQPHREIQWTETPAKSHKAVLTAADTGKLPAEWVDVTAGAETHIPWAVQGDAAAKTAYLAPLKGAGENQFPVLVDNSGVVKDGSASVRLQVVSGKGAVGAGVVFGFRNPQAFFGVRVSPRDVVLYQLQGGERALLARTSTPVPLKQWHTLGVDLSGNTVKVNLDGKPLPDLTKQLNGYRGGRFGMNTQGDTVAMFDQWAVTVK